MLPEPHIDTTFSLRRFKQANRGPFSQQPVLGRNNFPEEKIILPYKKAGKAAARNLYK
jgi:hypothetical protein